MPSSFHRVAAILVALSLGIGACSGDEPQPGPSALPTASPTPTPDPTCPLTGLKPSNPSALERPAVALKIENSPAARPQHGLEDADLVYEEIVEGGITRFMAIFHCGTSKQAGPVRSARFDDPKIARPFTEMIAFSGANDIVETELEKRGIAAIDEDDAAGALFRIPPGVLEIHNLFGHVEKLRSLARQRDLPPPPENYFKFAPEPTTGARRARKVTINFTSGNTIEYRWRGDSWLRFEAGQPFMTADGEQIAIANLLIQEVEVNNSSRIFDTAGNPSPDIDLTNGGRALLFRDGTVTKGRWISKKEGTVTVFETKAGDAFTFSPGSIWIELVPSRAGSVKGSFDWR
ncbi:MAG TPA: DUF3048 domain-containing protein [Actinomycetota bacterium]|nr:DUF3048 domain-containing protein [Actinomycetota bacterium]